MNYSQLKRLLDLFFLVIISPLILVLVIIVSIILKIENFNDKVFFTQERVGKNNKTFNLYKFRTMNSENNSKDNWTKEDDSRISRIGKVLRKTRIDEIPQFYNVFRNEMSLIGPRPEQTHLAEALYVKYGENFSKRHSVLPGITGYAQINFGYVGDFENWGKKIDYDLYYINHFGLILDIKIFFRTFLVLLKMFGSR